MTGTESAVAVPKATEGRHRRADNAISYDSPDAVFRAHYSRLVEAIGVAIGDDDTAADVVQEAFVQLWLRWDDVCHYEDLAGWVRRVAIHRAFDRRRSLARRARALLRLRERAPASSAESSSADSPILQAFRSLPPRQRLAMGLYYVADMSVAEVAAAMGVSEGSVKQHLHRGREALRRSTEADHDF